MGACEGEAAACSAGRPGTGQMSVGPRSSPGVLSYEGGRPPGQELRELPVKRAEMDRGLGELGNGGMGGWGRGEGRRAVLGRTDPILALLSGEAPTPTSVPLRAWRFSRGAWSVSRTTLVTRPWSRHASLILHSSFFIVQSSVFRPCSSSGVGDRGSGLKARPPRLQAPGSRF